MNHQHMVVIQELRGDHIEKSVHTLSSVSFKKAMLNE